MKRLLALALACSVFLSSAAEAAITVTQLNSAQGSGASLARTALTIPANGLGIVGGMMRKAASGDTYTLVDTNGNAYTIVECTASGAANPMFVGYFRYGGTGLTAGSITLTPSASATAMIFDVAYATGIKTPSPEDTAVYNAGVACALSATTTSPSLTSGTPTLAGDLMINVIGRNATSAGFSDTEDAGNGWVALGGNGNTNIVATAAYAINAGSSSKIHNPTMNSAAWTQMTVGFFDSGTAPSSYGGGTTIGVGH